MKKTQLLLLCLLLGTAICAQQPTTTWPYLYNSFTNGQVITTTGNKINYLLNVHLKYGRLHFIENNFVKEARMSEISTITIGTDTFANVNGKVMQVLAKTDSGFVAAHIVVDLKSLQQNQGAYGTSTVTAANDKYSSLMVADNIGANHAEMRMGKSNGQEINTKSELYIVAGKKAFPANRKKIENMLPQNKIEPFRQFVKAHKVKWKKPDKLLPLVQFLCQP